ncbi:hypothetical protein ACIBL6_08915 [Streptomyces sp. NPDC050400]|uniref:hypothetical protein n=1 Tax=Streptomyces sp. NPDC050400 TaxID=3365610 RepID=UPI0037BD1701
MTPEDEEQLPPDPGPVCRHPEGYEGECPCPPGCVCCAARPPQPEHRPPFAVDYSAGGHAYQILVPGDASVVAVDGALYVRHAGYPVLGISCVTPLKVEG